MISICSFLFLRLCSLFVCLFVFYFRRVFSRCVREAQERSSTATRGEH